MNQETKEALGRIHKALLDEWKRTEELNAERADAGLPPVKAHEAHDFLVVDSEGVEHTGQRVPLVTVNPRDTFLVCEAVPVAKLTRIVKDLRMGARPYVDRDIRVQNQASCLWHLVGHFGLKPPSDKGIADAGLPEGRGGPVAQGNTAG